MTELKQRARLFADMAQGGYLQNWDILDGDKVVGQKVVQRENRKSEQLIKYFLGEQRFDTAAEFMAAYEKQKQERAK